MKAVGLKGSFRRRAQPASVIDLSRKQLVMDPVAHDFRAAAGDGIQARGLEPLEHLVGRQVLVPVEQDASNHHALLCWHDPAGFQQARDILRTARYCLCLAFHHIIIKLPYLFRLCLFL